MRIAHRLRTRSPRWSCQTRIQKVGLADEHRAGFTQAPSHDRIGARHAILTNQRSRGGRHALLIDQVLERQWNAVERSNPPAGGNLLVRLPRLLQRFVGGDRDERVQRRIELGNPSQALFSQLFGFDLAQGNGRRNFTDRFHCVCLPWPGSAPPWDSTESDGSWSALSFQSALRMRRACASRRLKQLGGRALGSLLRHEQSAMFISFTLRHGNAVTHLPERV